jgi:hypothetical protein
MIALIEEYHAKRCLTLHFCVNELEQAAALDRFQDALGKQTDIEAINENLYALRIWPGHPGYPCDGGTWEPTS